MEENNVTAVEEENGEDMLLVQIDAFRDKAKQLQSLIAAKENKVRELEAQVKENEENNARLQEELREKQEAANGLAADVETQVDRMLQKLQASMEELESSVQEQVANNQNDTEEQNKNIKTTLEEMTIGLDGIKSELSEKVHTENVKQYRNIQDLMKELDKSEEEKNTLATQFSSVKGRITATTLLTIVDIAATVFLALFVMGIM